VYYNPTYLNAKTLLQDHEIWDEDERRSTSTEIVEQQIYQKEAHSTAHRISVELLSPPDCIEGQELPQLIAPNSNDRECKCCPS
jgi:CRISPR/Cas system-associated endonuclease Cas1